MPRGRHRHSPPLHRLLPPSTVAGVSLVCAGAAWLVAEPVVLRALAGVAAVTAVVGSIVMRRWDRQAGKRVAELTRARASDEWKHEERVAELESDLEESREVRGKLETKLRSKRAELAALRSEHAALLRRYATAETQRASALEGRRQLAIEASAPAKALPPAVADGTAAHAPSPALYLRANAALDRLRGAVPAPREEADAAQGKPGAVDAQARTAAVSPRPRHYAVPAAAAVAPYAPMRRPVVGGFDFFGTKGPQQEGHERAVRNEVRAIENKDLADVVGEEALALHRAEGAAEAEQASRTESAEPAAAEAAEPAAAEPAAAEPAAAEPAAAGPATEAQPGSEADAGPVTPEGEFAPASAEERAVGAVIDLTAHDDTEQLDLADLRSAIS